MAAFYTIKIPAVVLKNSDDLADLHCNLLTHCSLAAEVPNTIQRGAATSSYCSGEKLVGFQILLTTLSTMRPFTSLAFRAACHSGSSFNAAPTRSRGPTPP